MQHDMTPRDMHNALQGQVESVAKYLFPQGKKIGGEWCVGDTSGAEGKSCKVQLRGGRAGMWCDFASGEGGDLIDLVQSTQGLTLPQAMDWARDWLGMPPRPKFSGKSKPKTYSQAKRPTGSKPAAPGSSVWTWLTEVRGIEPKMIEKFKIMQSSDGERALFPYLRDGQVVRCKVTPAKEKEWRLTGSDQMPCLYGWDQLPKGTREVWLTEGELDAIALTQLGMPALSLPMGGGIGGNQDQWLAVDFDRLSQFDTVYLAGDMDETGIEVMQWLVPRLGESRCRMVSWPDGLKDANDYLLTGPAPAGIAQLRDSAGTLDPSELKRAGAYKAEIQEFFHPQAGEEPGYRPRWGKAKDRVHFGWNEVSIVNGMNGHGKSEMVGQFMLDAMMNQHRVCIFSGELTPKRLLGRLARQAAGLKSGVPSPEYIDHTVDWLDEFTWIFDLTGNAKAQRLIEVFSYAYQKYGCRVFVIDSLLKCGIADDDYNGQKNFVEALCDWKNTVDVHVFLVTHSRKQEDEKKPTGKMDVRGAGAITDLVDQVFTCWRNKSKEDQVQRIQQSGEPVPPEIFEKPDAMLIQDKNRNRDWEGRLALWFQVNSHQFLEYQKQKPKPYVGNFSNQEETIDELDPKHWDSQEEDVAF